MNLLARLRLWRASRRLDRAIRDAEVNILTALDHINFGRAMLRAYEKKHDDLCAQRARLQSPADARRCIAEPI
jgi:hypothetical protein